MRDIYHPKAEVNMENTMKNRLTYRFRLYIVVLPAVAGAKHTRLPRIGLELFHSWHSLFKLVRDLAAYVEI